MASCAWNDFNEGHGGKEPAVMERIQIHLMHS